MYALFAVTSWCVAEEKDRFIGVCQRVPSELRKFFKIENLTDYLPLPRDGKWKGRSMVDCKNELILSNTRQIEIQPSWTCEINCRSSNPAQRGKPGGIFGRCLEERHLHKIVGRFGH